MQHQDWETVVFKKAPKSTVITEKVTKQNLNQNHNTATGGTANGSPAWKVEKQIDAEDGGKPLNLVSSDVAKSIIGGRIAMKLTQKQLAQRLNLQEKDIKEIESCKAIENKALLTKIKRTLNI